MIYARPYGSTAGVVRFDQLTRSFDLPSEFGIVLPDVVPSERALRSGKYVEDRVIEGLARVGNEDAAQILIAVVNESPAWPPNAETAAGTRAILARQALQKIAASTSNERLRQEIQRTIP